MKTFKQNGKSNIELIKGTLNTNSKKIIAHRFIANSGSNKRLIMGQSIFELWGNGSAETGESSATPVEANFTSGSQFYGDSSTIILKGPGGTARFGRSIVINRLIYDNYAPNTSSSVSIPAQGGKIRYLEIRCNVGNDGATSIERSGNTPVLVDTLVLFGERVYALSDNITVNTFSVNSTCSGVAMLASDNPASVRTITASASTNPINVSNLALRNITINSASGTRPITISNYTNLGGNSFGSGVTVIAAIPRTLYWVGGSGNWKDDNHWSLTSGGAPIGMGCRPTLNDNVVFDANSGTTAFTVLLDSNQHFYQCKSMTWTGAVAGSKLQMNAPVSVFGNAQLQSGCLSGSATYGMFYFYSQSGILTSNGAVFPGEVIFQTGSNYTIADNFNGNAGFSTLACTLNTNGVSISASYYLNSGASGTFTTWNMTNTTATFNAAIPYYYYRRIVYNQTGTNTFFFNRNLTSAHSITINSAITPIVAPSITVVGSASTFRLQNSSRGLRVLGNLVLEGSAYLNGTNVNDTYFDSIYVQGNLSLTAGKSYIFPSGTVNGGTAPKYVRVGGNFLAQGTCQGGSIVFGGANSQQTQFTVNGAVNVNNALIFGMNSTTPDTAYNSVNLSNNTNWFFFSTAVGSTFYWRKKKGASLSSSASWFGDWSDPGYWTTNAANTEGDSLCLPSPIDKVIFDDKSRRLPNDANVDINISSVATCKNFTTTYSLGTGYNRFVGTGQLYVNGSMDLSSRTSFAITGSSAIYFTSSDSSTIKTNGVVFWGDNIYFSGVGTYTLLSDFSTTTTNNGSISVVSGTFRSNGYKITTGSFSSKGSAPRSVNLNNSILYVKGFSFDINPSTNLTWSNSGGIIYMNGINPSFNGGGQTFNKIYQTDASTTSFSFRNFKANVVKFQGSGSISDNNTYYDSLFFAPGKTYTLASGSTQTLSDTIVFEGSGTPGKFINIRASTTGSKAFFYKSAGQPLCFDYLRVQDNEAKRNPSNNTVEFKVGKNSDNIGGTATGYWFFDKLQWNSPTVSSGPDQIICKGSFASLTYNFTGTGAYVVNITATDATTYDTSFADGVSQGRLRVKPTTPITTYTLNSVKSYDCGVLKSGSVVDSTQTLRYYEPDSIAKNNKSCNCPLSNNDTYVHFIDTTTSIKMPILSINDKSSTSDTIAMGPTEAKVFITPTVQQYAGEHYLQRYFRITPTNNSPAKVRVYITQSEINNLSTALGRSISVSDLNATLFHSGRVVNNPSTGEITSMDLTGAEFLTATRSGVAGIDMTTSSGVYWIEFLVPHFSDLVLHASNSILPLRLSTVSAQVLNNEKIQINWSSESEKELSYFVVERSNGNTAFIPIGQVSAVSMNEAGQGYRFIDDEPFVGMNYYRIAMMNKEGKKFLSKVVSGEIKQSEHPSEVIIYPNPSADGIFNVALGKRVAKLTVHNTLGKLLLQVSANGLYKLDLSDAESGIYILTIEIQNGQVSVHKLIKE